MVLYQHTSKSVSVLLEVLSDPNSCGCNERGCDDGGLSGDGDEMNSVVQRRVSRRIFSQGNISAH